MAMEGVIPEAQLPFDAVAQARNYMHTNENQKDGIEQLVRETASQLEQKNITLIAVIESIGEYMRDEDSTVRSKSLHYLAGILENLSDKTLSRQQVDVICTFLVQRIEDGGAVGALLALQSSSRFSNDMATTTIRAILENLQDIQTRPQKQRHSIIRLVHDLLGKHRDAIKNMGAEFLVGIIDLFGGEKDPRNLMLVFSVVYVVAMEWDLENHVESLFDSIFCYYPITFRPPPNDPYRITAQDLKERLRRCIAASSKFGEYAFPQLLEKLDSGSPNIKRDVFDTLLACIQAYDPLVLAEYSNKLWDSLKYEVFHAQEEDLADESLKVIQANAARLCTELPVNDSGMSFLKKYLDTISKECLEKLPEPQHKQAKYASRILAALAVSSHNALDEIVKAVFPSLLSLYQGAETIEVRRSFLECFLIILEAAVDIFRVQPRSRSDDISLDKFKDPLIQRFSQALMSTSPEEMSYRILALSCLAKLSNIPGILSDDEVGLAVQYFNEIVLTEDADGRPDLVNKAIDTLLELSESRSQVLLDITIPKLLAELPDTGSVDVKQYRRSISILARLSTKHKLSDTIIRRLLGRLDVALTNAASSQYCEALLAALTYAIKSQQLEQTHIGEKYAQKALDLIKRAGEAAIAGNSNSLTNIGVTRALGRLVCLIIQTSHDSTREKLNDEVYKLFTNEFVITDDKHSTTARQQTVILSTYILAAINDKLASPLRYAIDDRPILEDLVRITLASKDSGIQFALLQHITLLVNKFADSDGLLTAWNICKNIGPAHSHETTSPSAVKILMFLAKAQILRMSNTKALLDHLLGLLETEDCGALVAAGFEILLGQDEVLIKQNGAKIRLLSGQVVFTHLLGHVTKAFPHAAPGVRPRYLIALGGILKHVDQQLALSHMKELNPLLLQSLIVPDAALKGAVINVLGIAISEGPSSVEEHLSSIITQLLQIATNKATNEASLRLQAMRCLATIPGKFKEFILIPHVKVVDRGVVKVLDDPRRDVRKAAVDCRTAWLALDEPDEDD